MEINLTPNAPVSDAKKNASFKAVSYTHLDVYKRQQLEFYKIAVEKTLKKKVKQACLYSFVLSKECYF